ncbi:hypothetical protein FRC03_003502 [Tulasnella sp. 419]|nr:hypothetical protein FRC03_003502 [Tulasnella sp. 419]
MQVEMAQKLSTMAIMKQSSLQFRQQTHPHGSSAIHHQNPLRLFTLTTGIHPPPRMTHRSSLRTHHATESKNLIEKGIFVSQNRRKIVADGWHVSKDIVITTTPRTPRTKHKRYMQQDKDWAKKFSDGSNSAK